MTNREAQELLPIVNDLALLVGRMARRLRADGLSKAGDRNLADQAVSYLKRNGLVSTLRDDETAQPEQAREAVDPIGINGLTEAETSATASVAGLSAAAPWSKPMSVQETWAAAPAVEGLPDWNDPRVQAVYEILCSFEMSPNKEEHWEGWTARRIVGALTTHREHPAAQQELADMEARKDAAYEERNRCVALIARMAIALGFKAGVTRTAIEGWSEDWHGCVYVELPTGQASWHFHDSQAYLFEGLPSYEGKWDGHTTPQKYERVGAAFSPAAQQERQEVLRDGATIYTLNANGTNRWSARVDGGHDDDGRRISEAECERIAAALAAQAQKEMP
jgi:hypothetical protein